MEKINLARFLKKINKSDKLKSFFIKTADEGLTAW